MKKAVAKREWVRKHLGDLCSPGALVTAFAKEFSIRDEERAAEELKALLSAEREIEDEFADSSRARHAKLGETLMQLMIANNALGPAAQLWKSMAQMKGFEQQKLEVNVTGSPNVDLVRERIAALMQKESIQERAKQAEVDLQALASADNVIAVGDKYSPAGLLARQTSTPSTPSDDANQPSLSTDPGDNILLTHIARSPALGPK